MNILQINKFYHIIGGTDRYFFEVSKLLKEKGHNIKHFTAESNNFINIIFNIGTYKRINNFLDNFQANIVHIHSIYHHLTPSVLLAIKKKDIPIVQTLEDYHIIASNYNLFHNGKVCEITKPNIFYKALFHKCVKNSYLASAAEVVEKYIHYWLGWERNYVDYFLAPSKFMRNKLIDYGLSANKIIHLSHFIDSKEYKPNYKNGNYILYFGRLSPEKGLNYLIDAMKLLPKIKLLIVGRGTGGYEKKLKEQSGKLNNIQFIGFKDEDDLKRIIANSRFTVLPSVWYEVFGLSILEAFASGKPVIASDIGGISETVKDGYNGLLAKSGNINDLVNKINKLWNNPLLCQKMSRNARDYVEQYFGPDEHYEKVMEIYRMAINKHS